MTPKGTPPQPTRRSTKNRRPEHGRELMARAAARRARRLAAAQGSDDVLVGLKQQPRAMRDEVARRQAKRFNPITGIWQ
jgi:hypothetical protein